jgi:hypothetical protein
LDPRVIPAGDASIPNEVFNLIKSIVGADVSGLPALVLLPLAIDGGKGLG